MLCYNEGHLLLLEYFITFFNCIRMIGGAQDSILEHLMLHIMMILLKTTHKFHTKSQISGTLSAQKKHMPCCNKRHTLLLDCFIIFNRFIRMIVGAWNSIYKSLIIYIVSFLQKDTLKFHKYIRFQVPSHHIIWGAALQGESFIAVWVVHNLPQKYIRMTGQALIVSANSYGPHRVMSAKINHQNPV